jgi:hypothetical protein
MNPPLAPLQSKKRTKSENPASRVKPLPPLPPSSHQSVANPDKIDEKWRPASKIREPGEDGDTYLTGKKLGRGGFAVCFEGRSERQGELFALKVVKSHVEQKKQLEKVCIRMDEKEEIPASSADLT